MPHLSQHVRIRLSPGGIFRLTWEPQLEQKRIAQFNNIGENAFRPRVRTILPLAKASARPRCTRPRQKVALDGPKAHNPPSDAGWSSLAARRAHNPKVTGSNPVPATNFQRLACSRNRAVLVLTFAKFECSLPTLSRLSTISIADIHT